MHFLIERLLPLVGALGIFALVLFLLTPQIFTESESVTQIEESAATSTEEIKADTASSSPPVPEETSIEPVKVAVPSSPHQTTPASEEAPAENTVTRIQDPYTSPPLSFDTVNIAARSTLVNILCTTEGAGVLPTTASGVLIDPRGVILTNAHVAQYVLLAGSARTNLSCVIRHGSPAVALWEAEILFLPPIWIREHAEDISKEHPTGTGEHDYALLRITRTIDGSPLPSSLPALAADVREKIAFLGDPVLAAGYPAEFVEGNAQSSLYPVSSLATVQKLLTFGPGTVDIVSIGGIATAQNGSSGGSVVNAWNRLVAIITTTSSGATTAERDLRAITLSYIDRDLKVQSGWNLQEILNGDIASKAADFRLKEGPALVQLLIENL